jgi:hypothetical protein
MLILLGVRVSASQLSTSTNELDRSSHETIHHCLPGVHSLLSQSPCDAFGSKGQLKWKLFHLLRNEFGFKSPIALVVTLRDPEFQITDQPVWLVNCTLLL